MVSGGADTRGREAGGAGGVRYGRMDRSPFSPSGASDRREIIEPVNTAAVASQITAAWCRIAADTSALRGARRPSLGPRFGLFVDESVLLQFQVDECVDHRGVGAMHDFGGDAVPGG